MAIRGATTVDGTLEIDLNSDLGESFGRWELGDDAAMLEVVSSANVACGFHAGDPSVLRRCCTDAAARGVAIGAQVSYPDLQGFGRRYLDIDPDELADVVLYQLGALDAFARAAGTAVRYCKPHGALYHAAAREPAQAEAVVRAVRTYDPELLVLGLPGSHLLEQAQAAGLGVIGEAFADRGYRPDGHLVPRGEPRAMVEDPDEVAERMVRLVTTGRIEANDGSPVEIDAGSVCVHGDTSGAVAVAQRVREALIEAGVTIRAFAT